jgi:ribosomal protein S18 acetylase RimI-like enzyme
MTQEPAAAQPVAIRRIAEEDRVRVVDMLARAFDDDPALNHIARKDARRPEAIRGLMDMALNRMTYRYGETYMTEDCTGAMLWNPPGQRPHGLLFDTSLVPATIRITSLRGFARGMSAINLMEKNHPKEPHYYLLAIGVDPPMQGHGVGSALLQPMVERLDAEGVPAYLESSKERNIPLYERFGWHVTQEYPLPGGGPLLWAMWRAPGANG